MFLFDGHLEGGIWLLPGVRVRSMYWWLVVGGGVGAGVLLLVFEMMHRI